jgi:D-amino-acid oxidase
MSDSGQNYTLIRAANFDSCPRDVIPSPKKFSRLICRDKLVHAIKGQLVLLPPQPNLQYLFSGHHGYLLPRHDCVVVGGSEESDPVDDKPDMRICRQMLANVKGIFEANAILAMAAESVPVWAMRSK